MQSPSSGFRLPESVWILWLQLVPCCVCVCVSSPWAMGLRKQLASKLYNQAAQADGERSVHEALRTSLPRTRLSHVGPQSHVAFGIAVHSLPADVSGP